MPWVKSFSAKGVPDVSYDDAFAYSAGQLPARNTNSAEKTAWLPNFGLSYDLTDTLTLRAMYEAKRLGKDRYVIHEDTTA